jgi:hypothetical protein
MKRSLIRTAGSGAVVALFVAIGALVAPGAAQAATAETSVTSEWADGYVATTTVRNAEPTVLTTWRVEFDLPVGTTISQHWNATLTRTGTRVVFQPESWNGTVAPGGAVRFGWTADGVGKPTNCTVNFVPCAGGPDLAPPSTPTNLRATAGGELTLTWDAATDNVGVTGYQIFTNGRQIAQVTSRSYSMPTPPPMVMAFGVRAVDSAGNLSPFAVLGLGTPANDVVAPSAPTQFTFRVVDGVGIIGWTASSDNVMVAGYRVTVNQAVSKVGGTFAKTVYRPGGVYQILITAFDSAGNLSIPLVASFVAPTNPTPTPTHTIPGDPVPSIPVPSIPVPSIPTPTHSIPGNPAPSVPVTVVPAA